MERLGVLQSLHNLSDERTEYLIRDRISFMRRSHLLNAGTATRGA